MRSPALLFAAALAAAVAHGTAAESTHPAAAMSAHANGSFDVKVVPNSAAGPAETGIARMSLEKVFHGDLEAASKVDMMSLMGAVKGSGTYVALERVTGTLAGKQGSFALAHHGTMNRGVQQLDISVVPDSGTDGLAGIAGTMTITIDAQGHHTYAFDYVLPAEPKK